MPHLTFKLDSSKFSLAMIKEITLMTLEMTVIVKAIEGVTNDLSLRNDPIKKKLLLKHACNISYHLIPEWC